MKSDIHYFNFLGVQVAFPYEDPYPAQRAIMAKSIIAFTQSKNALLESPTVPVDRQVTGTDGLSLSVPGSRQE